jgi:hypothetical protein
MARDRVVPHHTVGLGSSSHRQRGSMGLAGIYSIYWGWMDSTLSKAASFKRIPA